MTILFLSNSFGSLANFRNELIIQLCKDGYKVVLGFPFDTDVQANDFEKKKIFQELGCIFYNTPMNRVGKSIIEDVSLLYCYKRIYKDIKPDVVLTYTIKPNIYATHVMGKRVPVLINITGLGAAIENGGFSAKVLKRLYEHSIKRSSKVFFQNRFSMDFFSMDKEKKVWVPGSGVNTDKFSLLEYPEEESMIFLFVGRIFKEKGIDEYIEAAKYFKNTNSKCDFWIVGKCDDDKYVDVLNNYASNGIVRYFGPQSNVQNYYKVCSCVVMPSYYPEGMNNVLLEASSSGRPIITTDRPGCIEAVEENVNGFICRQHDKDDLIDKIKLFISLSPEQRKNMGIEGRKKMIREFNRQDVIKMYVDAINKYVIND